MSTTSDALRLNAAISTAIADAIDGKPGAVGQYVALAHEIATLFGAQDALRGYLTPDDAKEVLDENERLIREKLAGG